ncbi:MAG TPA: ABC transporter substrate-binding protein [Jatrophihabitantaceae bacterium]|jgi:peptide/nickel transport system substrate-binding protein
MRRRIVAVVTAAALVGTAALFGGTPGASAKSEKTLTMSIAQIKTFNPFIAYYDSELTILGSIYPSLTQFDANNNPAPYLATSWTQSADKLSWTFKIRQGLKWTDNQPITAKDAAWTFNLIMTNDDAATANGSLVANFASVTAPDDSTLIIKTKTPQANLLYIGVTGTGIPIVPQHIWESRVKGLKDNLNNQYPVIGYGPWKLTGYKPDQYATLEANKDYYDSPPKADRLILQYFKNDDAAIAALKSGQISAAWNLPATGYKTLQDAKDVMAYQQIATRWTGVEINPGAKTRTGKPMGTGNPILADAKVRLAMAYAIDRETLVKKVLNGLGTPGQSYIPPAYTQWAWKPSPDEAVTFDLAKANQILDAAGYLKKGDYRVDPKTNKQLAFRLGTHADEANDQQIAPYLVGWFKSVGIKLTLQPQSFSGLNDNLAKGDWDLLMDGWSTGADPTYLLSIQTCDTLPKDDGSGGNTDAFFCDPHYDELFKQQTGQFDTKQRAAIISQMQDILYQANADIMFYNNNILWAVRTDKVANFRTGQPDASGSYPVQNLFVSWKQATPVGGKSSSSAGLWIGIGIAAVVVVAAGAFFALRRRSTAAERE